MAYCYRALCEHVDRDCMKQAYRVSGDIICGAFTHIIEAESPEEALELVKDMDIADIDMQASERCFVDPDSVELA